jgi:hypothetical protein
LPKDEDTKLKRRRRRRKRNPAGKHNKYITNLTVFRIPQRARGDARDDAKGDAKSTAPSLLGQSVWKSCVKTASANLPRMCKMQNHHRKGGQ